MFFKLPTLVYFEDNCVLNHQDELAQFGKKALIVMGKSSARKNGSFADVVKVLQAKQVSYEIFDEVQQNPSLESIEKAYLQNKDKNIEFVIGIGGGSSMDSAKAIAVMLKYHIDDPQKLFAKPICNDSLPLVAIATTCGTGSEVTAASVLTDNLHQRKASMSYRIYPKLALLDSKYLTCLPYTSIRFTAIDALSHLIESIISSKATTISDMISYEGLRAFSKNKPALLDEKKLTKEVYDNLLYASLIGGMAIAHCGTNLPHGLSYTLTYHKQIPHGQACGYFLYGLMKYADEETVAKILAALEFSNLEQFKAFIVESGQLVKLDDDLLNLAVEELKDNEKKLSYCPYPVDEQLLSKVAFSLWKD
ncbi:MAG: iron-containing alcohol dehydrogenase family protein [Erysipelotrichaceae bacterium]